MIVRTFMPRFAKLVESGEKLQTVRLTPKRMPKIGDVISLREWTGLPYRSPQRVLKESVIIHLASCNMDRYDQLIVGGTRITGPRQDEFAVKDGFKDAQEMFDWFEETHGWPFEGILTVWKL